MPRSVLLHPSSSAMGMTATDMFTWIAQDSNAQKARAQEMLALRYPIVTEAIVPGDSG